MSNNINYIKEYDMLMVDEAPSTSEILKMPNTIWGEYNPSPSQLSKKIASWGPSNNMPFEIQKLIFSNPDAPVILQNLVNFLLGQGIIPYREIVKNGKVEEVAVTDKNILNYLIDNEEMLEKVFREAAYNYYIFGSYFVNYIYNVRGNIVSVKNYDAHSIRCMQMGKYDLDVSSYAVYLNSKGFNREFSVIPAYSQFNIRKNGFSYIYQGKDYTPASPYYPLPVYIGAWRTLELASMVIQGQIAALENGWNVKYLLSVHASYYNGLTDTEAKLKKEKLTQEINNHLAGVDKNNKTLVVSMVGDMSAQHFNSLIKIEPIDNNKENSMLIKLLESKDLQVPRAFNIDPELSGIVVGSNLSSGSEILNKYNLHLALKTPTPRKILLRIMKHISASYGWDKNIKWKFKDIKLAKLSDNKTGVQTDNLTK